MNIFFKLLAICGLGGSIGGTTYLSQQSYTNVHEGAVVQRKNSEIPKEGIDVKKQPGVTSKAPEARQGESTSPPGGDNDK